MTDRLDEQRSNYVKQLTDKVIELQHHEECVHECPVKEVEEKHTLVRVDVECKKAVVELKIAVESLKQHLVRCPACQTCGVQTSSDEQKEG